MSPSQTATLILQATWETMLMVVTSTVFAVLIGLPIGVFAFLTSPRSLRPNRWAHRVLDVVINIGRSLPFIILLVLILPLTRLITGTTIGPVAAIVPLTLAAAPFFARLVETSLREVPKGKIDAGEVLGASIPQLVWHVLLPEALPGLVSGITVTFVSLIGYSAMAGAIGGGGLGDVAIRYGYQRYQWDVTVWTVVVLLGLTMLVQWLGDRMSWALAHR